MAASVRSNPIPKFVQAETVLCYEPDLTKSRVLYEAKVRNFQSKYLVR